MKTNAVEVERALRRAKGTLLAQDRAQWEFGFGAWYAVSLCLSRLKSFVAYSHGFKPVAATKTDGKVPLSKAASDSARETVRQKFSVHCNPKRGHLPKAAQMFWSDLHGGSYRKQYRISVTMRQQPLTSRFAPPPPIEISDCDPESQLSLWNSHG